MPSTQVAFTDLLPAGPITGQEIVAVVQNGWSVQTTVAALAGSPILTQSFLTANNEPTLNNSRQLAVGAGLSLADGGSQAALSINLTGALANLNTTGNGVLVKTGLSTFAPRTLSTSGLGLSVTNGDGIASNPTFQLTGISAAIASTSGTGMLAIVSGTSIANRTLTGTANQITVTAGNGTGNPTFALASNPVLPGTASTTLPIGGTAGRPVAAVQGMVRYNTDLSAFEGYTATGWVPFVGGTVVTSVTATSPVASTGGTTPVISLPAASSSTNGYLTSTDWNTFNSKGSGSGTVTSVAALTLGSTGSDLTSTVQNSTTTPIITLNVPDASATNRGVLTSADWSTFNSKGSGTVTSVSATSPVASTGGATPVISMPAATTSVSGYLTSTDWTTFNGKGSGTVTSVTGTAPVVSSGGATPAISMAAASASADGYLTSTDWSTFNGKGSGTVTSVAATVPAFLSVTGSPITSSGTLAISYSGTALPVLNGGTGASTASGARTNLGLGTIATQNANTVAITGGAIDGTTVGGTTAAAGTFTTLIGGSGSANYEQITGGATTKAVQFQTLGTDTNISKVFQSKGTGAIDLAAGSSGVNISNGGTVTALTITNSGSGYTSVPTIAITAPTTAGGVQAAATAAMSHLSTSTISNGGTGYAVNDTLTIVGGTTGTAATFTVTTVSGGVVTGITRLNTSTYTVLPSSPSATTVSPAGGTGCTIAVNWAINGSAFTITNAGSGYVEQPTVTFSGGGGSGAAAYATVGGTAVIKGIGTTGIAAIDFQTSQSITASIPAMRIRDQVSDSYPMVNNTTNQAGITAQGYVAANLGLMAAGTGSVRFFTNGTSQTEQMRVSHTASAVNYVQVTGAATGNKPTISALGSDANIDLTLTPKGTGRVNITTSIKPKVNSAANVTSPLAWDSTSFDEYAITALANALTINADANAAPADGQRMMFRFKDNGTARALTWTTGSTNSFRVVGVTLPTTTVASKLVYVGCVYNAADSRWDAVAVSQEA